jgi:carboxyl-terminal processing protease
MKCFVVSAVALLAIVSRSLPQESFDDTIQKSAERLAKIYYRPLSAIDLVRAARAASTTDTDKAMQAMITSLNDPESRYYSRAEIRDLGLFGAHYPFWFNNRIGIELEQDNTGEAIRVRRLYKDWPAYKAGIRTGDRLFCGFRISPFDPTRIDLHFFTGMSPYDAELKLRGPADSTLWLFALRDDEPRLFRVRFTHAYGLRHETISGYKRKANADWDFFVADELRMAYIRIDQFAAGTDEELLNLRRGFERANAKGLILDLRFCPVGLLTSAARLCEELLPRGRICSVRGQLFDNSEDWDVNHGHNSWSIPLVCLVNGETTSAAEIVAACLQDHHRAVIVGERTAGQGQVQNIANFPGNSRLKYTFALFHRPDGRKLSRLSLPGHPEDEWGVTPDRVCLLADKETYALRKSLAARAGIYPESRREPPWERDFRDRQLESAVDALRGQLSMK